MKVSVLFDINLKNCSLLLVVIVLKWEYFLNFLAKCFFTVCFRFSCMLGWLWLKNNFVYIWFFGSFSLQLFSARFRLKRVGQLNGWFFLVHLDWYKFKWKWNSSSTLSKWQISEKKLIQDRKKKAYLFLPFLYFVNNFRIIIISKLFAE